jgi:transcription antitermination factor NusG
MDKSHQFSEGDTVRVTKGAFASFCGRVAKVDKEIGRLTVVGRFEGERASDQHTINVSLSVVEKIENIGDLS